MLLFKYLLLSSVFTILSFCSYCRNADTLNIYQHVRYIEQSSLPDEEKLSSLHNAKAIADTKGLIKDSGYFALLVKIAKYESAVNNNNKLAVQYSLQALQINRTLAHKASNYLTVNACYNLATYYQNLQNETSALAYYDTAIILCGQHDPDDYIILSRYQRTIIYFSLVDLQKAIEESSLGINEAQHRNDSYYYTCFLNFRARACLYDNQITQAFDDVEKALSVGQNAKGIYERTELANSYETKAMLLDKQRDYKQAEFYFKEAISVRPHEASLMDAIAVDYNNLGNFYLNNGNNRNDLSKAKANFFTTINYANQCNESKRSTLLIMAYENLGDVFQKEGKHNEALTYYQQASNVTQIGIPDFLFTDIPLNKLAAIQYKDIIYALLFARTELLFQFYQKTKQVSYLKACLNAAIFTDTFITQTRHENLRDKSKLYWRNKTRNFFNTVIEASFCSRDANMAFYFMEKSRAALLNDKWNELNASSYLSAEDAAREELLRVKIIEEQQILASLNALSNEYHLVENRLLQARNDFDHYVRSLEKKYPLYYQTKYADDVPSLPSLQQYLTKNHQSLVYYFTSDSAMYSLAITPHKTAFIKITASDFDSRQLFQFIQLCNDKQQLNKNYALYCSLSQTIYKKLFEPLQIPKGNVAICTDNFFIPFEALCTDERGKHILLNDYSFNYIYSARSLMKTLTIKAASGNFIGFAPVSFSSSLAVPDLMQSSTALKNTAQLYSNHTLFTEEQASRQNFFNNASRYSVVTIFSHAKADTTDAEPELFMQDSVIHLSELQRLVNPATQFVLLSACQTNIGKNATGEGIYSLARGFASAGIPSVSATLWKADEEAIYQISTRFNEYLSQGMNKSEALRKAKLWYLQNADHEHTLPYYWANMVLIGSSEPLTLTNANHWWLWVSAIVTGFVFATFFIYHFLYKRKKDFNFKI